MPTRERLTRLRQAMTQAGVDGYLQPVHDEYMSEYPPDCNRRVAWLTGFSGSAGAIVVLADKVALFVDGRYTLQAVHEVDTAFFEIHNSADMTPETWLAAHAKGLRIGYDPKLTTAQHYKRMQQAKLTWVAVDNLVDAIWETRPIAPATPIFIHDERYAGESAAAKRTRIAKAIAKSGADAALITMPDSVCWLLNIRAHDVPQTPLVLAPLIIDRNGEVQLFVHSSRVDTAVSAHLGNHVALVDPALLAASLVDLGKAKRRVLADPATASLWHTRALADAGAEVVEAQDPCLLLKAMKNAVEIAGIKNAHIRDGQAIIRVLSWLDREVVMRPVTEMEVADRLFALRKEVSGFSEPSFNTIAGSGPHGAIVHYRATDATNRALAPGELFLLDSGAQYPDGTTDITRTIVIGAPSDEHKDRFTRVLKGHIAIATAQFPVGTCGSQLDALARQYLWQAGLDYDHGTGHGVGCFLGVHEGPQRISKRAGDAPLAPGMVVSNEPGYYKEGAYGIRIENLVAVTCSSGGTFLSFETLTCAPIDTRLVDVAMLTVAEKEWLNHYHAWVLATQLPHLAGDAAQWLTARCSAL